jgi:O-antigen ligase
MKIFPQFNPVNLARWLIIALSTTILFSPFLTNVLEITLFGLCLFNRELRSRLVGIKNQPLAIGVGAFILMLIIGCFYSMADYKETLSSLWGWRKILLLPIALSLFADHIWKDRFLNVCVGFIFLCSILSIVSFIWQFGVYRFAPGIIIRNYATQGMVFAVAIFSIVMRFIYQKKFKLRDEWPHIFYIASILIALVFMTPGRSGYLAFIVLSIFFCYRVITYKKNYWVALFVCLFISSLLFNSSMVKDRINLGVNEISNVSAPHGQETSMGLRINAWKNALELIKEHPVLGVGTGAYQTAYVNYLKDNGSFQNGIRNVNHDPHNQFMKILAELGSIGLLIFIAFLASTLLQKVTPFYFHLSLGVLIAWCATSLFSSHFSTFTEGRFIYIWLGIMLASESNRIKS